MDRWGLLMSTAAAKRVPRDDGYGRSTRFYEIDGQKLPSVTAILGAVNKPALIPWAAKQEREMVYSAVRSLINDVEVKRGNFMLSLEYAVGREKAHSKELSKAATIGSEAHSRIEWHLRNELKQATGPEPQINDKALWAFMAWEDWRKAANLSVSLVEEVVWSKRYGYAGTLDFAGQIDHESERLHVVADNKTGARVYKEAHLQIAAYGHALVEMQHADVMPAGCIVRLPKTEEDPAFEVVVISPEDMTANHKVFLNVLELWRWMDEHK
jgi:PD-(D/E)XK nuclease superfamily protein